MAEKFRYGPLVYNCFGEDDDSGNFWWPGNPPVGYEQPKGIWKIPIDAEGNQCLPGECILHPNCRVAEWDDHVVLGKIPSLVWCRSWFEENFLIISDWDVCRYIVRWLWHNSREYRNWKSFVKTHKSSVESMIKEIWPDVIKS